MPANRLAPRTYPVPSKLRLLFEQRPLIYGESVALYDTLVAMTATAIRPRNVFDWFVVKRVVDIQWEITRYNQLYAGIMSHKQADKLAWMIHTVFDRVTPEDKELGPIPNVMEMARAWLADYPKSVGLAKKTDWILAKKAAEFDLESQTTEIFSNAIPMLEGLNRVLAMAEIRYERTIRSLERSRQIIGPSEVEAVKQIPKITRHRRARMKRKASQQKNPDLQKGAA